MCYRYKYQQELKRFLISFFYKEKIFAQGVKMMKNKITAFIIGSLFAITSTSICIAQPGTGSEAGAGAGAGAGTSTGAATGTAAETAATGGVAAAETGISMTAVAASVAAVAAVAAVASGGGGGSSATTTHHH